MIRMFNCREVTSKASDYIDRNQTFMERLQVSLHLLMCGKCRLFVRHLRAAITYFNSLPPEPTTEEQVSAIVKRISDQ